MDAQAFGQQLKFYRTRERYSQAAFGQLIGKPQTTISEWERGGSLPDVDDAIVIAHFFGMTVEQFLDGQELAKPTGTEDN